MFDIIIIGGGPAGLTASIYALRAKKKVLLIEKMAIGGQAAQTNEIENYPGFEKISGIDLSIKMFDQAQKLGLEFVFSDIQSMDLTSEIKTIITFDGKYETKSVILCMGATAKQLEVANEKKFLGKGVSYCATCDGNFFKNKIVAVVGGGNSSLSEALYLSNIAQKVYLIHRREKFTAEKIIVNKVFSLAENTNPKIKILTNSVIQDIKGNDKVESITISNHKEKTEQNINVDGIFIAIGRKPDTAFLAKVINLDESGYIITDEEMKTNIEMIYAAGDIRKKGLKQIITACSDGAIAAMEIVEKLNKK